MKPKIRGMVTAVPTSSGITFQMGESFLRMEGRQMYRFFTLIEPFLDGRHSLAQLLQATYRSHQRPLMSVLKALRDAGMLYDAAADVPPAVEAKENAPHASLLNRIENTSNQPSAQFAKLQNTRVLVLGRGQVVLPALAAFAEYRPHALTFAVSDWNPGQADVLDCQTISKAHVQRTEWRSTGEWHALIESFDVVIFLGSRSTDRSWMQEVESSQKPGGPTIISLVLHSNRVLVGPVLLPGSFSRLGDVLDGFRPSTNKAAPTTASLDGALQIGIHLLVQKLVDLRTGVLSPQNFTLIHDIDATTLAICERPAPLPLLPQTSVFHRTTTENTHGSLPGISGVDELALELDRRLQRISKRLVDPVTGLIHRLEEHDLYQIPHHQSGALWLPPGSTVPVWTTEAGDSIFTSRFAVVLRVFEEYLAGIRRQGLRQVQFGSGDVRDVPHAPTLDREGVVVCATAETSLHNEAFFKALALYACNTRKWTEVPLELDAIQGEAALTFGYLADINELDAVRIDRCRELSVGGCDVLRFNHRGKTVSVVAGPAGQSCWQAGLQDIWLHLTAKDALQFQPQIPEIRLRCASSSGDRLRQVKDALISHCGFQLILEPLQWPEPDQFDFLLFARAYLNRA